MTKDKLYNKIRRMRDIWLMKQILHFFRDKESSWKADFRKATKDYLARNWLWYKHPEWHGENGVFAGIDKRALDFYKERIILIINMAEGYGFIKEEDGQIFLTPYGNLSANSWILFILYISSQLNKLILVAINILITSILVILAWVLFLAGQITLKNLPNFICDNIGICNPK